ncbi:hypothetical protein M408DRAFT_140644 [Serendipita vermifera MAFF 305830]|uniref:Uncharacterized protein n=1 Tax=Serendipita vermifera MAFF 305830 TaxID=933852 RepID=A0A0C2XGY3_SERVB|nr:hypothetical protein M408DRAFT_140644 [Serendipita vermifera MAFF 305830]
MANREDEAQPRCSRIPFGRRQCTYIRVSTLHNTRSTIPGSLIGQLNERWFMHPRMRMQCGLTTI